MVLESVVCGLFQCEWFLSLTSVACLQCEWFFSSWDEDVNVPVDEVPTEPVPISGMSEQLLAKAESLGKLPVGCTNFSSVCWIFTASVA